MNRIRKIKEIHLVYENCDYSIINFNNIDSLYVGRIYNYYRNWNHGEIDFKSYYTKDFYIVFKDLENLMSISNFSGKKQKESVLKRLQLCQDITHIDLIFEDKTNLYISIPWGSKNNFYNAFQILGKNKQGLYFVDIAKKWNFKKLYNYINYLIEMKINRIKHKIKG